MYNTAHVLHLTGVDKIVRDHLYDMTRQGAPAEHSGLTVNQILLNINTIRKTSTDAGAIRRSLTKIENSGMATRRNAGAGTRSQAYKWKSGEPIPKDYQYRPLPAKTVPATTGSISDAQRNKNLDDALQNAWEAISGTPAPTVYRRAAYTKKMPAAQKKVIPVIRPNGEEYYPRELAGKTDVETLRALRSAGLFTLFSGPPGSGKTAALEAAFSDEPGGLYTLTGDEETKVDDFVGQWYPTGKPDEFYWADGPLTLAVKNGGVLFVDDATLINPKAIACLYPLMDGRGVLQIKSHLVEQNGIMQPEMVLAQPGFFIAGAHNPGVQGAILSEALASRFRVHIWMESDIDLAGQVGVSAKFLKLARNMRTRRDNGQLGIFVPEMRELLAARDVARVFGEQAACENLLGLAPEDCQDDLAREIKTTFGFVVTPKRLQVGGRA